MHINATDALSTLPLLSAPLLAGENKADINWFNASLKAHAPPLPKTVCSNR